MTTVYDIQIPVDLLHEGKLDEAIPMLQNIADAMPSHVTAHVLLAQALTQEERWEEAKIAWQNAAFLMPNSPAIRRGFHHVLSVLSKSTVKPAGSSPEPEISVSEPEAPVAEPEVSSSESDATIDKPEASVSEPEALVPEPETPVSEIDGTISESEISIFEPEIRELAEPEPQTSRVPKNTYSAPLPPALVNLTKGAEIEDDDELDDLIQELESARIVPKPEHEAIETPVLESDIDDMVSETLARIFEGQKQFDEAARVYDRLAALQPDRADDYMQKASDLRARAANESD